MNSSRISPASISYVLLLGAFACTPSSGEPDGRGSSSTGGASTEAGESRGDDSSTSDETSSEESETAEGSGGSTSTGSTTGTTGTTGSTDATGTAGSTTGTSSTDDTLGDDTSALPTPHKFAEGCAPCHGGSGEGIPFSGPEILHPKRDYAEWVVRNGRPAGEHDNFNASMATYSVDVISEAELVEIFDYLDAPPKPTDGQGLYVDFCGHCHGAMGEGPQPIARPVAGMTELTEHVREGHHPGEYSNRSEYMPSWDETELTDAEIALMAEYLSSL